MSLTAPHIPRAPLQSMTITDRVVEGLGALDCVSHGAMAVLATVLLSVFWGCTQSHHKLCCSTVSLR